MVAIIQTRTDTLGLTDSILPGPIQYVGASAFNFHNDTPDRIAGAVAMGLNCIRLVDFLTINSTKVAIADNGLTIAALVSNGLLHVGATFGPTAGSIAVQASGGIAVLSYSGKTGGFQITGLVAGSGAWTVATNNLVLEPDGSRTDNEIRWAAVDNAIAQAAAVGLRVVLDLTTYRNWLAKLGTNPYLADWSTFLAYVGARVNTSSGIRYSADPTILYVALAGEPQPGGQADGNGNTLPITSAQMVSFFGTVAGLAAAAFPKVGISSGGLLHYRAGSVGDTSWVDWQGIFGAVKTATDAVDGAPAVTRARAALHVYSGVDFGNGVGSGDEAQVATIASYTTAHAIPLFIEETGLDQNQGQGVWVANDALRAQRFRNVLALGYVNGVAGILFWNDGTELYFASGDVNGSSPVTLVAGAIPAWNPVSTYGTMDAVVGGANGSQSGNWYSLISGNTSTPNDANSTSWGKLKTSTLDVNSHTPLTFAAVRAFAAAVLQAGRSTFSRVVGQNPSRVSVLTGENDYIDENGVPYWDENHVPYAIGF